MNRPEHNKNKTKDGHDLPSAPAKTIRLADLIPKKTVKGGSQVIFGTGTAGSKSKTKN